MMLPRSDGVSLSRKADRQINASSIQEPPRKTRYEPEAGPTGSNKGCW
jgi:hypothetical protein